MYQGFFVMLLFILRHVAGSDNENSVLKDQMYLTIPGPTLEAAPGPVDERQLECVDMVKIDSDLVFEQTEETRALCGAYFIGDPDDIMILEVHGIHINCDRGEFIEIFDGWMAQNKFLPSEDDHESQVSKRIIDFCRHRRENGDQPLYFESQQNFALVQFRLLSGSQMLIRYRRHKSTNVLCNVLTPDDKGEYAMISSVSKNCTFSILQPSILIIKEIKLTNGNGKKGMVEILKGESLDSSDMTVVQRFEAPIQETGNQKIFLDKMHGAVRMISPGHHDNLILFTYSKLTNSEDLKAEICT